jgi:hypothetical protein
LERLSREKHSSVFGPLISYGGASFITLVWSQNGSEVKLRVDDSYSLLIWTLSNQVLPEPEALKLFRPVIDDLE